MSSHHHEEQRQQHHDVQPPPHPQQQQLQQQQQHYQQAPPPHQQQHMTATVPGGQPVFDLGKFWQEEMHNADTFDSDFKNHPLPLARIKKVMKTDQDVKMISAEAPILFAKGCEIFITELTKRAWVHAEENKRRTLQRSDIATAISKTDMCDFLIDIVPREEAAKASNPIYDQNASSSASAAAAAAAAAASAYVPNSVVNNPAAAVATAYYPPQYAPAQIDPNYYSQIPQFTNDQVQQYQMQLQQFAQQNPHYEAPDQKPKSEQP